MRVAAVARHNVRRALADFGIEVALGDAEADSLIRNLRSSLSTGADKILYIPQFGSDLFGEKKKKFS